MTNQPNTWTFFGHWQDGRIVVEEYVPGQVTDDRDDTGLHEQGLWAASASGETVEQAQATAVSEYQDTVHTIDFEVTEIYQVSLTTAEIVAAFGMDPDKLIDYADADSDCGGPADAVEKVLARYVNDHNHSRLYARVIRDITEEK